MASQFERTLKKSREDAAKKLKIIAPNYKGPVKESGISSGSSSSRGRSSRGRQSISQEALDRQSQASRQQQEAVRVQAENQKRAELVTVRQQRIEELQRQNKQSGILSSESSSRNIILARERAEVSQAGKTARAESGTTGEVKAAPEKGVVEKVVSKVARIKTGKPKQVDVTQVVKKGVSTFREKLVVPLREKLPSLGETPIGIVAQDLRKAKEIIESKQPGETIRFGLPGQIRDVEVSKLQNLSPLSFGGKIVAGEVGLASKDIAKTFEKEVVIPLSESKVFRAVEKEFITPISEFGVQPIISGVESGVGAFREKVVVPLRETLPSLGDTPIGQIAEAKRIIDRQLKEFSSLTEAVLQEGLSQEDFSLKLSQFKAGGGTVTEVKEGDTTTFQLGGGPTVRLGLPGQIRDVPISKFQGEGLIGFGKEIFLGEVEQSFTDILKSDIPGIEKKAGFEKRAEFGGKAVRVGTELLGFTLPGAFVGEVAAKGLEAQVGKGAFGGPESFFDFAVENPLEVGLAIGVGSRGIVKAIKAGRVKKLQEFVSIPERKALILETRIAKETSKLKITKPRLEISKVDDLSKSIVSSKTKGRILETQFIPEARQTGKVIELRKIGKKLQKFEGFAEVAGDGVLKETIKFGDITKITEVTKGGKGTVKLFKKGKSIFEQSLNKGDLPELKFLKSKVDKLKIDKQFGQPGVTFNELIVKSGDKVKKSSKLTDDVGDLILSDKPVSLRSKLVTGEFESTTLVGRDISKGIKQTIQKEKSFLDIIQVSERKGLIKRVGSKGNIQIRRRIAQEIEFGVDKTFDQTLFGQVGKQKLLTKVITPNIQRDITAFSGQRTTTLFINPASKELKALQKAGSKVVKARKLKVDVIDRALAREQFDDVVKSLTSSQESKIAARKGQITDFFSKTKPTKQIQEQIPVPSKFAFGEELNLPRTTFVQPTEEILKVPSVSGGAAPFIPGLEISGTRDSLGLGGLGIASLLNGKQEVSVTDVPIQIIQPKLSQSFNLDINSILGVKVAQLKKISSRADSRLVSKQFQQPVEKVISRVIQRQDQKLNQKQLQRQLQRQQFAQPNIIGFGGFPQPPQPRPPKIIGKINIIFPPIIPKTPSTKTPRVGFGVQIRRGGEFFNVGSFRTQRQAFEFGKRVTSKTLAATFRLSSPGKTPKAPKGFREKDTPLGKLFIERRSKRLSKKTETIEIQAAKRKAPKKKTKSTKKKK